MQMKLKPMLAEDYIQEKLRYPLGLQPKIDGVRSFNFDGSLTGRSLKKHKNKYITKYFSKPIFKGLDGEMAALHEVHPDLCRFTSSALSTVEGTTNVTWHCFDYLTDDTYLLNYKDRYSALQNRLNQISKENPEASSHLRIVPMVIIANLEQLISKDLEYVYLGYEGSIIRDIYGLHKEGRSTVNEGGFLRIKHFIEEDAVVTGIIESQTNTSESIINELGYKEKSHKKKDLVPGKCIGSFICIDCKTNKEIIVAAGKMPRMLREYYFRNKHLIIGQIIKYRYFPKGGKNKPRFPTYQSHRIDSDIMPR